MKKIKDYPMYAVTKDGRVYSYRKQRFLKPFKLTLKKKRKTHYTRLRVQLFNELGSRVFFVHRLIAEAFIENPDNLPQVNHLDCNPLNNHFKNLEWCTPLQNVQHSIKLGRHQSVRDRKLTEDTVRKIRRMYISKTLTEISRELEINISVVDSILKGRTYRDVI